MRTDKYYWLLIAVLGAIALLLIATRVDGEELTRERRPKPARILVEKPILHLPAVILLDVDGWAKACDGSNGWTTGNEGHLEVLLSPVTTEAQVMVYFQHAPEMGDQRFDLVDGSQSLSRAEWQAVTLAAGEVWNYVAYGLPMSYPTGKVDAVMAVHEYLFLEGCLQ